MEQKPTTLGALFENAGDYLETRVDLIKLKAIDKASDVASSLVSGITMFLLILFAVILVNIGLALWIGELVGKSYLGFLIVAGLYMLIALLLHFFKDAWIKEPISSILIKKMLS
ncbi:MAG: hypothetical protein JWP81_1434 [Ferruginibacter sp.]|nr:hypothetical protein [Ferruginibacter sp.]